MADIFISYSSKDRELAAALAADLEARGHAVWWDFNLVGGQGFREQIHAELIAARAVIVIWTKDSVASKWVRDEADEADRLGKLIPVRVPKLAMHDIPMGHRGNQTYTIDARERIYEALAAMGVASSQDGPIPPPRPSRKPWAWFVFLAMLICMLGWYLSTTSDDTQHKKQCNNVSIINNTTIPPTVVLKTVCD